MLPGDRRPRTVARARLALAACMAGYVLAVYWLLVLGVGTVLGNRRPSLPLAVLATAVVAVSFEPVRGALARRLTTSPYEMLAEFTGGASGAATTEELAPRIARLLAEATSAHRVEVWLRRDGSPEEDLAARWPPDAEPIGPGSPGVLGHEVRHGGEVIGRIVRDGGGSGARHHPVEQRLIDDLLASAALPLRTLALTSGLYRRIEETTQQSAELRASRGRIVSAADAARRRLERDIHDGAQQHLVALAVNLSLAATVAERDPARAAGLIDDLRPAAETALATLEQLSRGVYPPLLADAGLAAALQVAWSTSPVPVRLVDETKRRFPAEVEAAAYFCCLEAVQNAVKHAQPTHVQVRLATTGAPTDATFCLDVQDDGTGFDVETAPDGSGLANMRDRIESLGGTLTVHSHTGRGTRLSCRIPVPAGTSPGGHGG